MQSRYEYDEPKNEQPKKRQLFIYCLSDPCTRKAKKTNAKKDLNGKRPIDCPDCGHALFYSTKLLQE